ncbi:MAG: hypothetical protein KIS78_19995 [Labilithrix sp.]|nr:hypothetical protein [Labilithrix sp.]MCW5834696.1 hypothetical protein [Labilithrix sp.]
MVCLTVAVSCSALVACGGRLHQDDTAESDDRDPKTTLSAPGPIPATVAPYGSWDLVSLDGMPGGNGTTLTQGHLFLELRPSGDAVALRCARPYYEAEIGTFRCADPTSYDCLYGTLEKTGDTWRVDVPDLRMPASGLRGEILAGEDDNIVIRYILPKYSAGHFVRLSGEDSPTRACAGP